MRILLPILLLGPLLSLSAQIEKPSSLVDRGYIDVGWFFPMNISSKVRLDSTRLGLGTKVSYEDDLGFADTQSQFSARAGYYFNDRFQVSLEYYSLNRSNSKTLTREINWGDETFEIGARVKAFFDVELIRVAFGYDILRKDNYRLGFTLGAHVFDAATGIDLVAGIGENLGRVGTDAETGGLFPIPNLGINYSYSFNEKWRFDAWADWFGISLGEWDGTFFAGSASFCYFLTENWSLGLGVQLLNLEVNYDDSKWKGRAEFGYIGPRIDLSYQF
jgi:hypothetical protein